MANPPHLTQTPARATPACAIRRGAAFLLATLALLVCAACAANPSASAATPEQIISAYPGWTHTFDAPRETAMQLALLCRSPNESEQAFLASDHAKFAIQLYVNPTGASALSNPDQRPFPPGTVIVKEKWFSLAQAANDKPAQTRAGLGIMQKLAPGSDPASGDWKYLYVSAGGAVTGDQNQLSQCRACHLANGSRDSVFYPSVLAP